MSAMTMIGLGLLAWVLLAIALGLFIGHVIWLRDQEGGGPSFEQRTTARDDEPDWDGDFAKTGPSTKARGDSSR